MVTDVTLQAVDQTRTAEADLLACLRKIQAFGQQNFNLYVGAFLGALLMTFCSELIARSPQRTPAVASQMLAFWFLVPGSRGLLSVTSLLTEDVQSPAVGLGQMAMLIPAITLGILISTLLISPQKFVPVTAKASSFEER